MRKGKIVIVLASAVILVGLIVWALVFRNGTSTAKESTGKSRTEKTEKTEKDEKTDIKREEKRLSAPVSVSINGEKTDAEQIVLTDDVISFSSDEVELKDEKVIIKKSGIYSVSGSLSDGQLTVDCDGEVTLVLDNVSISNSTNAAIKVKSAKQVLIYMQKDSVNELSATEVNVLEDGTKEASGAVIQSVSDLILDGQGTLILNGNNDGIRAGDSTEGIGDIEVRDGYLQITVQGDGIQAGNDLTVNGGDIQIVAVNNTVASDVAKKEQNGNNGMPDVDFTLPDGSASELPDGFSGGNPPEGFSGGNPPGGFSGGNPGGFSQGGGRGGFQQGGNEFSRGDWGQNSDGDISSKGLKCEGLLTINGGNITISSTDDGIHSGCEISVTGGTMTIVSGDDGIHADEVLTIEDGTIHITESYEGLEAHELYIRGGIIDITASDDGMNANGGSISFGGFGSETGRSETKDADETMPGLQISGGIITIDANGDGLDSNGDLIIDGGEITVDGPTNSGNGALDSGSENGGSLVCNGGTVLAIGASGMAESFESTSKQCSFMKNFSSSFKAGTVISVIDESGTVIFMHTSTKSFNSVVFSSPELKIGKTYTLKVGDTEQTVEITNITNGDKGTGFGGPGRR